MYISFIRLIKENTIVFVLLFATILVFFIFKIYFYYKNLKFKKVIEKLIDKKIDSKYAMYYDVVTNLPNRLSFLKDIDEFISIKKPCTVILFDIDNFKKINDALGHSTGDMVLNIIAQRIHVLCDEKLELYRYAGDEFGILIKSDEDAYINKTVAELENEINKPISLDAQYYSIHASIGIARYPEDGETVDDLVSHADLAQGYVDGYGKSSSAYFHSFMQREIIEQMEIEKLLQDAIENDGFYLRYQPQIDVLTGEVASFEALLRLKKSNLSPAVFISVAENTGQIIPIGRIVVDKVLQFLRSLKDTGLNCKSTAINFSNIQLNDEGFIDYLKERLHFYRIDPKYLDIEITESVFMERNDKVKHFLEEIRNLGVDFILDDFGTGYSSFKYLIDVPFEKIKLDKSLTDRFLSIENSYTMERLIALIHSLNLTVVCEGVEHMEQFYKLQKNKCDYIQGYVFEKPLLESELNKVLDKNYFS